MISYKARVNRTLFFFFLGKYTSGCESRSVFLSPQEPSVGNPGFTHTAKTYSLFNSGDAEKNNVVMSRWASGVGQEIGPPNSAPLGKAPK